MSKKHKHGKHNKRISAQAEKAVQNERLGVLLDWYLGRVEHYEKLGDKFASAGNEKLLEVAAGKWMLFRYKAEKLIASL